MHRGSRYQVTAGGSSSEPALYKGRSGNVRVTGPTTATAAYPPAACAAPLHSSSAYRPSIACLHHVEETRVVIGRHPSLLHGATRWTAAPASTSAHTAPPGYPSPHVSGVREPARGLPSTSIAATASFLGKSFVTEKGGVGVAASSSCPASAPTSTPPEASPLPNKAKATKGMVKLGVGVPVLRPRSGSARTPTSPATPWRGTVVGAADSPVAPGFAHVPTTVPGGARRGG